MCRQQEARSDASRSHHNTVLSLQATGAYLWWVSMMPSKSDTWSRSTKKASQLACRHSGTHLGLRVGSQLVAACMPQHMLQR